MIELIDVNKSYKTREIKTEVLKDINLIINKGEFVSLMGPSGCGKSTLLNILGNMDRFDSGEYLFEKQNIKDMTSRQAAFFRNKKIGFIFQAFHLIDDMNAIENVQVPMGYAGLSSGVRKERAKILLEKVCLLEKSKNHPSQLSGGQQQRVAIARALANHPDVLLADEPTGNLDHDSGIEIMNVLKKLNEEGMTIIMVTHDSNVAEYSKRKIKMLDGKIVN